MKESTNKFEKILLYFIIFVGIFLLYLIEYSNIEKLKIEYKKELNSMQLQIDSLKDIVSKLNIYQETLNENVQNLKNQSDTIIVNVILKLK